MIVMVVVVVAVVDAVQSANPLDLHIALHRRQDDFQTLRNSLTDYSSGFAFSRAAYQAAKEGDEAVSKAAYQAAKEGDEAVSKAAYQAAKEGDEAVSKAAYQAAKEGDEAVSKAAYQAAKEGDEAVSKAAYQAAKEGDEAVCEPRTPSLKNPPQQPIRACAVLTQPHSQDHPGGVLESSSQCLVAIWLRARQKDCFPVTCVLTSKEQNVDGIRWFSRSEKLNLRR